MRIAVLLLPLLLPAVAGAKMTTCDMRYDMKGWSAIYQTASGHGTVTCGNGQKANVTISAKGGGPTVGKTDIEGGTGRFSEVKDISEIFGSYARAGAEAGAVKAGEAQVLTKGEVSLTLAGTGRGFSLGIAFGNFTIERGK